MHTTVQNCTALTHSPHLNLGAEFFNFMQFSRQISPESCIVQVCGTCTVVERKSFPATILCWLPRKSKLKSTKDSTEALVCERQPGNKNKADIQMSLQDRTELEKPNTQTRWPRATHIHPKPIWKAAFQIKFRKTPPQIRAKLTHISKSNGKFNRLDITAI